MHGQKFTKQKTALILQNLLNRMLHASCTVHIKDYQKMIKINTYFKTFFI